jgi:hypothetical protein
MKHERIREKKYISFIQRFIILDAMGRFVPFELGAALAERVDRSFFIEVR